MGTGITAGACPSGLCRCSPSSAQPAPLDPFMSGGTIVFLAVILSGGVGLSS